MQVFLILALLIAIPVGIWASKKDTVEQVVRPILDFMQTLPAFVYLIPAMMLFGLGKVPAVIATLIYALPPVIRLTCLGLQQVPKPVQEAARAYGATRWQLLKEVRIPLAMPSILAGVNQTTMMALAMGLMLSNADSNDLAATSGRSSILRVPAFIICPSDSLTATSTSIDPPSSRGNSTSWFMHYNVVKNNK